MSIKLIQLTYPSVSGVHIDCHQDLMARLIDVILAPSFFPEQNGVFIYTISKDKIPAAHYLDGWTACVSHLKLRPQSHNSFLEKISKNNFQKYI